ncbi:hypothetical protein A6V39_00130 [Candidatus Mycoplasma haematobovis]|uniref:Uncharacterized protein n=1 Tax=Candidatus Mycoplasma haematobovis TaxID=432608 RepID=A0A1A9QES4_9MOLU|nr:hypothetical protein [Candidatus Mycoplasma haematobovis]OAL10456.1 hypothetical protein A6V39_00130 [Candidatus Mycoplasma haematobovis]
MTSPLRAFSILGTFSVIGGASSIALGGLTYGSYALLAPSNNIKDILLEKNKTPIDLNKNDEFLKALTQQYHSKSPAGKKEIENFTLSSANDFTNFKNKCDELLNTPKKHLMFL